MNGHLSARLSDIMHSDAVLLEMYRFAMPKMSHDTAQVLEDVVEDHERHQVLLGEACEQAEVELPEPAEDVTALMDQYVRLIHTAADETSMLETLSLAEYANSMIYGMAEFEDLPEDLDEVVSGQHADERLHVSLLSSRLDSLPEGATSAATCLPASIVDDRNPDDFE